MTKAIWLAGTAACALLGSPAMAQLPPGSTRDQSDQVLKKMEMHFFEEEKDVVEGGFGVLGFSFSGNAQNQVLMFVKLKPWGERKLPEQKVKAIQMRALGKFGQIKEALAFAFAPPAVLELGTATGFDMRLVDLGGLGHEALMDAQGQLLGMAAKNPLLASVRPNGLADTAAYQIEIDQEKASALGLSLADINASLSTILGSTYVNDFIDKNRVKRVMMQGDAPFRMLPEDINRWYVRNAQGGMVPFSAFSSASWKMGSPKLERFNGSPSLSILGEPARGTVPVRPFTRSFRWQSHCRQALALPGQGCRMKSRCQAPRPHRFTSSLCSWSSSALPRSMRAGPFRSR